MYSDTTTLARKLKVSEANYSADLIRVLNASTLEMDREINGPFLSPSDEQLALLQTVNLGRAQDLWVIEGLPVGVIGLGGETPLLTPRDSWERWARMLAPLRDWSDVGLA